jgi:hypothetical protein
VKYRVFGLLVIILGLPIFGFGALMGVITCLGLFVGDFDFNISFMFSFLFPFGMLMVASGWSLLLDGEPVQGSSLVSWRILLLAGILLSIAMVVMAVAPLFSDERFSSRATTGIGFIAALAVGYVAAALKLRKKEKGSWLR